MTEIRHPAHAAEPQDEIEADDPLALLEDRPDGKTVYTIARNPADASELERQSTAIKILELASTQTQTPEHLAKITKARAAYDQFLASVDRIDFHLRSIGAEQWDELMNAHPATEAEIEEAKRVAGPAYFHLPYSPEGFPPAMLSACIEKITFSYRRDVIRNLTPGQVKAMMTSKKYSSGDLAGLIKAATELNSKSSKVDLLLKG